ncbi:MAG TPA: alpha/beta fold hydrolase, partial [Frankiaceae bacterium]|nr:alpha/beta fold hydrolase [Frankiaceae bacterium]
MALPASAPAAGPADGVPGAPEDLGDVLRRRLRQVPAAPLLFGRTATVQLDAEDEGIFRIEIVAGRATAHRGPARRQPTLVVTSSAQVLRAIAEGRESGVAAFLGHRITVRGDLSLALALDGLFTGEVAGPTCVAVAKPVRWPRAGLARPAGIPTAYLEAGPPDAPPVVLLHGLGGTNASMLPLLWELAVDHRVLAPDLPGFGASGKPRGLYDARWFARWLSAFLDELDVARAVLVGNSMGGRVALEAGLWSPRAVAGLVLLAPAPAFRRLREWVPVARLVRPELAVMPLPLPHALVVEGMRSLFSDASRLPQAWYDAGADEFLRVWRTREGRVAFAACLRQIYLDEAYGERGFWARLPALAPPALFVWGERDRLVPVSFARHAARALPGAHHVVLRDCGHVPQFEHPEEVAAMVRGFL